MTPTARINLQNGVKENKAFPHTNYTNESPLDAYILHMVEMRKEYMNNREYKQLQKETKEAVIKTAEAAAEDQTRKEITKAFLNF